MLNIAIPDNMQELTPKITVIGVGGAGGWSGGECGCVACGGRVPREVVRSLRASHWYRRGTPTVTSKPVLF